jgi:hypothetical protein
VIEVLSKAAIREDLERLRARIVELDVAEARRGRAD